MTYTREQQAEHRAWWVADLRSGQYRQAHGILVDIERTTPDDPNAATLHKPIGFCCLAVACETAIRAGLESVRWNPHKGNYEYLATNWDGVESWTLERMGHLPPPVAEWLGLATKNGRLTEDGSNHIATEADPANADLGDPRVRDRLTLVNLNDQLRFNFERIANVVEVGKVEVQA